MGATASMLLSEQVDAVRLLTVNRPDKLNTFAPGLLQALDEALDAALSDEATRVVVITGAGSKAFVAGNDVEALAQLDPIAAYRDMVAGHRVFKRLHEFAKPTIAMVNGYALGGGFELALACDFIIASATARFGFPEIGLDTMPGWGGTQLAVQKMGLTRAKEMVLTGRHYTVDECRDFGFINSVASPDDLRGKTLAFAATLTAHHPFALEMAKLAVNRAVELPLHAGLEFEAATYALNFGAPHARAGFRNFLARRDAKADRPSRAS
jgi:enoyl-CoA hydratase/carnithine racemase